MFLSKLVGRTVKETPRDAELVSHRFLLRGGFVRQYASGVYGLLPLAQRSIAKIESICREEMNRIEGQEVKMPCLGTKELWDESGRYGAIGKDMFRLNDRNEKPMVLCMTHEEPVVFFARTELTSYRQLPAMMYQVQTKFRDEPRPRGGLIRLREFTMKDAYSFHASEEDLQNYYWRAHEAYMRFFKRTGCRNFVSVMSDNGMFGGKFSHEFMMLVPSGEDTLITCTNCDYKANQEIATSPFTTQSANAIAVAEVETPNIKTIADLAKFLKIDASTTCKAVMFQTREQELVVAFVRGDLDVVEQKLKGVLQKELFPAKDEVIAAAGAVAGSTGPLGLNLSKCLVVFDKTISAGSNFAVGANKAGYHLKNFNLERDLLSQLNDWQKQRIKMGDIAAARAGDPCPQCGHALQETRGIEIGNIFHLGTRYSHSMNCTYSDQAGVAQNHVMGCYGIGITRLLPAIIEESHDERGPILPITVAPFDVHICVLNKKEGTTEETALATYAALKKAGIEVLLDDRDEKPGSQFADADLVGIPLRIIFSPRNLNENKVEFKFRDNRTPAQMIPVNEVVDFVKKTVAAEYQRYALD
ncbi:MAG: proline--tRNA ligase [Betaproteobacteria bacterium]|nr:proline--tRNA ligase [Betaproteobacteria bacterium]